ncbi:hypothetical protein L211DRAFT_881031, partial [Terfezia boudieri ATCC MYA-4762]
GKPLHHNYHRIKGPKPPHLPLGYLHIFFLFPANYSLDTTMCINNTYSCPTWKHKRKETISCVTHYGSQFEPKTSSLAPQPPQRCCPGSIISQHLQATCQSCSTAYRADFEETLRCSITMSRSQLVQARSQCGSGGSVEGGVAKEVTCQAPRAWAIKREDTVGSLLARKDTTTVQTEGGIRRRDAIHVNRLWLF